MIYKGEFALQLAVYHFPRCKLLCHTCVFVIEYVLFVFHQRTPQDLAAVYGHEAVVSYLKRAADPNMLEVCQTVPLRIVVVSSGGGPTLTDTS